MFWGPDERRPNEDRKVCRPFLFSFVSREKIKEERNFNGIPFPKRIIENYFGSL